MRMSAFVCTPYPPAPHSAPAAQLDHLIRYRDGAVLEVYNNITTVVPAAEVVVVETGVTGHGRSNAVVRYHGYHYLATL